MAKVASECADGNTHLDSCHVDFKHFANRTTRLRELDEELQGRSETI
jgi:hypothetical protein